MKGALIERMIDSSVAATLQAMTDSLSTAAAAAAETVVVAAVLVAVGFADRFDKR